MTPLHISQGIMPTGSSWPKRQYYYVLEYCWDYRCTGIIIELQWKGAFLYTYRSLKVLKA